MRSPRRKKAKLMEMMNKLDHGATMQGARSANEGISSTTSFSKVVRAQVHGACGPRFKSRTTPAVAGSDVFRPCPVDDGITGEQTGGMKSTDETTGALVHCDESGPWRGLRQREEMSLRPLAMRYRDQHTSALLGELRLKMEQSEDEVLGEAMRALARHR